MQDPIIQLKIHASGFGGSGIGRHEGIVCFVPGALPEEEVLVKVIKKKKKYFQCSLVDIIQASPYRKEPVCPLAHSIENNSLYCPGCVYLHLDYQQELCYKNKQFAELLNKFSDISPDIIQTPIPSKIQLNYRNKITLHASVKNISNHCGYYANDNKTILPVHHCYLACKQINSVLNSYIPKGIDISQNRFEDLNQSIAVEIRKLDRCQYKTADTGRLTFRYTEKNGVTIFNDNDTENSLLIESTDYGEFIVPQRSFFQVNPSSHNQLISEFLKILTDIRFDYLLDIYCGAGVFGILAAKYTDKTVFGMEIDEKAVETARLNAELHKIKNINFKAGNAELSSNSLFNKVKPEQTVVILDPPRTGLSKKMMNILCRHTPGFIIYISCSADTLCRDINLLKNSGYKLVSSRLIDMFPRTAHFETISLLEKN